MGANESEVAVSRGKLRLRALAGMAISAVVAAVWAMYLISQQKKGIEHYGPGIGVPALPFIYFLTEFVTGGRVGDLSDKWDNLQGWQRGILGLLIVVVALGVIFGAVAIILAVAI